MSGSWSPARHLPRAVPLVALLALAACGTTPSPGSDATTRVPDATGTVRPLAAQPLTADGALACPESLAAREPGVPEKPQGVDGAARLLPDREPASLVVCRYPVVELDAATPLAAPFPLASRTLASAGERADIVALLAWAPRWNGEQKVCTMMAGDETAYLVGVRYTDAVVWVAATADPNSCSTTTNGDFTSGAALGVPLAAMFGHRTPASQPADRCAPRPEGRLGDDQSLAPDGQPSVTVCRLAADSTWRSTRLDAERSARVVEALRSLPTRTTDQTCQGSDTVSDRRFTLVLTYPSGPPVAVHVDPGCDPQVLGSNLAVDDASPLLDLVEPWSAPIPGPDPNGVVSSDGTVQIAPVPPDAPDATPAPGGGSTGSTGIEPALPAVTRTP